MTDTKTPEMVALPREAVDAMLEYPMKEIRRQRLYRIWGFVFKAVLIVAFIGGAHFLGSRQGGSSQGDKHEPHIAYIEIFGPIMSGQLADAERLIPAIRKAYEENLAKAVVLRINSPGGSPVHAGQIYQEIRALREEFPDKPIHTVIEDIGASAAYYIASATENIYVDQASMVGSIGVITSGFGYDQVMEKVGVERRVLTAGTNKAQLDPYLPLDPKVEEHWGHMLDEIHQQFITAVKDGRGDRLVTDKPELFSGLVWTGAKSVEFGLSDGLGSMMSVSRDTLGGVNMVNYTPPPDFLKSIAKQANAQITAAMHTARLPLLF